MSFKVRVILFCICLVGCSNGNDGGQTEVSQNKITETLRNNELTAQSKNDSLVELVGLLHQDSVRVKALFEISYHFYTVNDSLLFREWHQKSQELSLDIKDSLRIAESDWDLGNFFHRRELLDSSYFYYNRAYNLYQQISQPVYAGRMLTNMATIEQKVSDFSKSEITSTKALQLLKNSNQLRSEYINYNSLGSTYMYLEEYQKSLDHHRQALRILTLMEEDTEANRSSSLNNIGVVYQRMNKYREAIKTFDEALKSSRILKTNTDLHATLIDNRAYSRFMLGDTINVRDEMEKALELRDSTGHKAGIIVSKIHLSNLSAYAGDTSKAIKYLKQSNDISREIKDSGEILRTLFELSKVDKENAISYLREHISLNKKLLLEERALRNKFTKIKFETDRVTTENEKLYGQRNVLIGISIGIVLLGLSGFVIKNQRTRNQRLSLKQEQQEANEKVLQLLLDQQNIKESSRQKERTRLSEELHDGILAKLFGLRLSLTSLNSHVDKTSIAHREKYLEDLKELGKEIRQLSHELNSPLFSKGTGYLSILEEVISQNEDLFTFDLNVEEEIDWERVPGDVKLHFLRILQEAMKNIREHSQATEVKVTIESGYDQLFLTIEDNGRGFDVTLPVDGIGLKNMKSRTKAIKGTFDIKSHDNNGTAIHIKVPFKK